jgi:hypothetical protein
VAPAALTARTTLPTVIAEVSMDLFEWLLRLWQDDWLAPN